MTMLFMSHCLTLLSLATLVAGDLQEMLDYTDTVTAYDWEWVLIRINGAEGSFGKADYFNAADAQVEAKALDAVDPEVDFDMPLSQWASLVEEGTDSPEWFEIGMVAFQKGSVSQLEMKVKDIDTAIDSADDLMKSTVDLPATYDQWVDLSPSEGDYTLNISLWRTSTPIYTEAEQLGLGLTEVLFDLEDGSKASLVYKTTPGNTKAVFYFPGRTDSFAHPNVLQMYEGMGYDFYSLDPRQCGRSRYYMEDSDYRLAHSIDNFDKYHEEIELTMDFIRNQNGNYTQLMAHSHSTGALVVLDYVMSKEGEEPFDGYVFNGPFFDWAYVGGDIFEFALENAGALGFFGVDVMSSEDALSSYHAKNWIINRWNTTARPIFSGHVTTEWAEAVTNVQDSIRATPKDDPITSAPVLLIASRGDIVLSTSESESSIKHVAANYSQVILDHNSHDVTQSTTNELNEDAIAEITKWLENPENSTHSNSGAAEISMWMGQSILFASVLPYFLSLL